MNQGNLAVQAVRALVRLPIIIVAQVIYIIRDWVRRGR